MYKRIFSLCIFLVCIIATGIWLQFRLLDTTASAQTSSTGQVWVLNNENNTISRFNPDKTSAGNVISGNGLNNPYDIADVGSQVWVINRSGNSISRFNPNGTSAGSPITGNGVNTPGGIEVVGSQIWISNTNNNNISVFNTNGTPTGTLISGNGLNGPIGIGIVGSQVWVINDDNNSISRFNFNGTSAGSPITGNGLDYPLDLGIVGSQVWVVNAEGNSISRFNFNGTSAGSRITGNGLNYPTGLLTVGTQVWVTNDGSNSLPVFNLNGTSAGNPVTGNGILRPTMLRYNIPSSPTCVNIGVDYVLITDRSGSMNDANRITLAKAAARNFIDEIAQVPGNRVALVSFESVGDETTDLNFTTNFTQAKNIINSYTPDGLTCTRCGLNLARNQIQQNGRNGAKKVAIMLTDGKPWHSDTWTSSDEAAEVTTIMNVTQSAFNDVGMQLYAIGLGQAKFEEFLPDLVAISKGKSYQTTTGAELDQFYDDIFADILQSRIVSGMVFHDQNGDGIFNAESRSAGWEVTLTNGNNISRKITDSSGNFAFTDVCDGTYTLQVTLQTGWEVTTPVNPNSYQITILNSSGASNRNFGVSQGYTISGNIFLDENKNGVKDATETNHIETPGISITPNAGSIVVNPNGSYTISNLPQGTYIISYTSLPNSYRLTHPLNGPPPSYQVTVGPGCSTNGALGASCQ